MIYQDLFTSRGLLHRCSGLCYFFERGSLNGQSTRRLLAKLMGAWSCPSSSCYSAIVCRQRRPDRPFLVLDLSLLNVVSYEEQPSSHTSQNPSLHRGCPKRTTEELRNDFLLLTSAGIGSQLVNVSKYFFVEKLNFFTYVKIPKVSIALFNKGPNGWGGHCCDSRLFSVHVVRQRVGRAAQTQRMPRLSYPRHYCSILQHYGQSSRGTESQFDPILITPQVNIKEPSDGQWGRQMENGSWTGVVAILTFRFQKCIFLVWW